MPVCAEIQQSIDVDVPVEIADRHWTQFVFWNIYHRPLGLPDEAEAEQDEGSVRLQALDPKTTRVGVDLNYCPHVGGTSEAEEIARVEENLRRTLNRYKRFVESRS